MEPRSSSSRSSSVITAGQRKTAGSSGTIYSPLQMPVADRGHFIGSVVYIQTGDSSAGFTRWLLIDGQQRVTTLTLLLTAHS